MRLQEVTEADMNALCIAILDGAKESFLPHQPTPPNVCIPSGSLIKNMPEPAGHNDRKGVNESDDYESDGSMMSQASSGTYSGMLSIVITPVHLYFSFSVESDGRK